MNFKILGLYVGFVEIDPKKVSKFVKYYILYFNLWTGVYDLLSGFVVFQKFNEFVFGNWIIQRCVLVKQRNT